MNNARQLLSCEIIITDYSSIFFLPQTLENYMTSYIQLENQGGVTWEEKRTDADAHSRHSSAQQLRDGLDTIPSSSSGSFPSSEFSNHNVSSLSVSK
jgi:hypothetical protein